MSRVISKRKLLLVIVLFVAILVSLVYLYLEKTKESESVIEIFEIENTKEVYTYHDILIINIRKHYMMTNPPEDLQELKKLVVKFNADNPIDREDEIDKNKDRQYEVYFYRESKKLPRNWQPNEAYFNTDRIGHHTDDCIAVIWYSDSEPKKRYDIMKRSSNKADYGSIIEEVH